MRALKSVLVTIVVVLAVALVAPWVFDDLGDETGQGHAGTAVASQGPSPTAAPPTAPSTSPSPPVAEGTGPLAVDVLASLPVKGRAPKTGYDRAEFGKGWKDPDRNGCDARNDVLARDLTEVTLTPGSAACVVMSGVLLDPYTGDLIDFVRGQGTSSEVQIDHVVALNDAWQKGAQQLSASARVEFGNDPLNLLAVGGAVNSSKGSGDAATWLPPATAYRCAYVARQVAVKARHGLWVTQAEGAAIERVLEACPGERVPEQP